MGPLLATVPYVVRRVFVKPKAKQFLVMIEMQVSGHAFVLVAQAQIRPLVQDLKKWPLMKAWSGLRRFIW